jgi:hypothetical protein
MPDTDHVLVDPTEKALAAALADATTGANGRARKCLLRRPPPPTTTC